MILNPEKSSVSYGQLCPGVWFVPDEDDNEHHHAMFLLISIIPVPRDTGDYTRDEYVKLTWYCTHLSRSRTNEIVTEELRTNHLIDKFWNLIWPACEGTVQPVAHGER